MAETHIISGLKAKRDEVKRAILDYEQKIKTARADLATLNEALAIFGAFSGNPKKYFERRQLFERGELMAFISAGIDFVFDEKGVALGITMRS